MNIDKLIEFHNAIHNVEKGIRDFASIVIETKDTASCTDVAQKGKLLVLTKKISDEQSELYLYKHSYQKIMLSVAMDFSKNSLVSKCLMGSLKGYSGKALRKHLVN